MFDIFGIFNMFDKPKVPIGNAAANSQYCGLQQANAIKDDRFKKLFEEYTQQWGMVRVETWPEGLLVWVGGRIVYKSWENVKQPTGTLFG